MKKILRSSILVMLQALIVISAAIAGNPTRTGSSGATELLIPVGARGVALGESSLMSAVGVDALYWNPAGLSRADKTTEAMFSYMSYFADIRVNYGALGFQAGDAGWFGISLKSLNFGDIPVTTEDYPDGNGSTFSPAYITFGVSYSKLLTDRISVGVTSNLVTERIINTSASGFGFDFGIQYFGIGIPELSLGIAVKNVGPQMTFGGSDLLRTADATAQGLRGNQLYTVQAASFSLPSLMEIGLSYHRKLDEQNSIMVGGNFENNNASDDVYGLGGEYSYNNNFFIRGSYLSAPQAGNDLTGTNAFLYDFALGAGVHYDAGGADLTFDYAYRHLRFMTSNNVITLKVGF